MTSPTRSGSREAQLAPPFVVLHVCLGNICRSPMAERLLARLVWERLGEAGDAYVHSASAGTGTWHVGEPMNPPASRELRRRGAADELFRARTLLGADIDTADVILTATAEHLEFVGGLRPDASSRAFVLGEFGRLLSRVNADALPPVYLAPAGPDAPAGRELDPKSVFDRGVALVAAVDAARAGVPARPDDDLDDPWGRGDALFKRTADEIHASLSPFVELLLPSR